MYLQCILNQCNPRRNSDTFYLQRNTGHPDNFLDTVRSNSLRHILAQDNLVAKKYKRVSEFMAQFTLVEFIFIYKKKVHCRQNICLNQYYVTFKWNIFFQKYHFICHVCFTFGPCNTVTILRNGSIQIKKIIKKVVNYLLLFCMYCIAATCQIRRLFRAYSNQPRVQYDDYAFLFHRLIVLV